MKCIYRWLKWIWYHRNYIIIVVTPLILLPLPIIHPVPEARCGYVIILMALYWCTECMPLAVTGLLPIIFFPMMGIMKASEVSVQYMKDTNIMFVGAMILAIAVENWNLHKRIALRVLLLVGVRPSLLMVGFMIVTSFLSMWISNSASTAMMLAIANAVLEQLEATDAKADAQEFQAAGDDVSGLELETIQTKHQVTDETQPDTQTQIEDQVYEHEWSPELLQESRRKAREEKYERLTKALNLCVCYSAGIGGAGTLTGTVPNLIFKGQVDEFFPENGDVINFASWFGFAFPFMLIMLVLTGIWLQFLYLGFNLKQSFGCGKKTSRDREAYMVIKMEYNKLGPMMFAEVAVLIMFILLVLLWFTREPGFIAGWATVLFNQTGAYVTDGTVAIFMAIFFFIIPSRLPRCGGYGYDDAGKQVNAPKALLTWNIVHERLPWSIIFLLGGGYSLAEASKLSGLSKVLGDSLTLLQDIPSFAIVFLLTMLVATFTECFSNSATVTLFMPVLASMATSLKIHPLYVMLPCPVAASLAFMLPVATPSNAVAFAFGKIKILDMVKAGFMLNIFGILTTNLAINTWGYVMFDMGTFPQWANTSAT